MKRLLLTATLIFPLSAIADMAAQFTEDGTTFEKVKSALAADIEGKNLVIRKYSKSWITYNPIMQIYDPDHSYRDISFEFVDENNKKQIYKCSSTFSKKTESLFIFSCSGNDRNLREFHKLGKHGYSEDSMILDDIFDRSTNSEEETLKSGTQ